MSKFRKVLSALTSVAIASSMFTSLAVKAFDASISYADGKATATASGKLIAASYDESGLLTGIKLYDATADTPVDVEVSEGDKLMLWNSVDGENAMTPLTDAYTVQAPVETQTPVVTQPPAETQTPVVTQPPVETQTPVVTQAPVETQTPVVTQAPEAKQTYIDDNFDSYTSTGTAAQGTEAQQAELGDLMLYVGNRGSGGDGKTSVSLEDGSLKIVSANYATSSRGVSIAVNADKVSIPAFGEIGEGSVINYEFKAKFTDNNSTIQMMGVTSNTTTSGGQVVNDPYLSVASNSDIPLNEWVNVCVSVDNQKAAVLIIKDEDGNIVSSRSFTAVGDSLTKFAFYGGATTVYLDNLVITKDKNANGKLSAEVKNSGGDPVDGASVTVGRYTAVTGADGKVEFALPMGTYEITASKAGFEHTKGVADNDSKSVTVEGDATAEFELSAMSYDKIPETVNIESGQPFISAPKTAEPNKTAAFTVSVLDQYNIAMEAEEYTLSWSIYPEGTETADDNVTIDENGVVSVSQAFSTDNRIAVYDVTATVVANNEGLRGMTEKRKLYVGNNDVIYYEAIDWSTEGRDVTKPLASPVSLSGVTSVTMDVAMTVTRQHRTVALMSDAGVIAGIQLMGTSTANAYKVMAWTGTTQRNDQWNQSSFAGNVTNSFELYSGYSSGTELTVDFVIDPANSTVTISCGDVSNSLPLTVTPTNFTGFRTGQADSNSGANLTVNQLVVVEPDMNYLAINGDLDFAKVSGQTIEREYTLGQSVIVPEETFTWTVSPADQGVSASNGVLSVADTAIAGSYTLTATSDINAEKTASATVEIGDFQTIAATDATVTGAHALAGIDVTEKYAITRLVDSYGDDVTALLPAATWTSSDTGVATIDAATGELTTTGYGETTVTATITNDTAVTELIVPVTVAKYYITADATGDSTTVDTSNLISNDAITGYQVTTSKDGKVVKQEVVKTAPTTVDTTGADKFEIAPVFTVTGLSGSNTKELNIPADTYNFNITGASGEHFDPYVNDQMLANNMLQGGTAVNYIAVNDIVVNEGYAVFNIRDLKAGTSATAEAITVVKSPSIVERTKKVYVLGDSLVCIYANGGDKDHNYQTGLGQVLQSYLTDDVEVVDLGNSGVIAEGLATSAMTQVIESAKPGDIMLLESGYNDRSYTTKDKMLAAVKYMYDQATANGVDVVLVSPPSSAHDYKADVSWTSVMKQAADETEAKYFDLAAASYKFLYDTYGDSFSDATVYSVYNVSDRLHSTFHGANKMASIMAGGMIDLGFGDIVNTDYVYTFKDNQGNAITCQAAATPAE